MKALRYLLMVCVTVGFLSVNAQNLSRDWGMPPKSEMRSTSAMVGSGSALPMAAMEGAVLSGSEPNSSATKASIGPRKIGGNTSGGSEGREDPYYTPIGDGALPLAILACVYAIYRVRRRIRKNFSK